MKVSPLDRRLLEAARIMQLIDIQYAETLGASGACMIRALVGCYVLLKFGITAQQHFGALLYRVGPDPERDVLRFCAPNNVGIYTTNGPCAFHSWLYADGYVIDFSLGDWLPMTRRKDKDRPCAERLQWTIEQPPSYWVKRGNKVFGDWKPQGTPDIGKVWYGPMYEPEGEGTIDKALRRQFEHLRKIVPLIVAAVRQDGKQRTLLFDKNARQVHAPNEIKVKELLEKIAAGGQAQ
jgi:hypothetical protein